MLPTHRESVAAWLGCPAPDPTLGTPALQIRAGWPADAIGEPADETLQALRRLWSGAGEYAGKHVIVSGTLAILPVNDARLPIWVGGAVRRSAERARGWLTAATAESTSGCRSCPARRRPIAPRCAAVTARSH